MATLTLRGWVGSLDASALEQLLSARPDLLRAPPRNLDHLTARLADPYATIAAIRDRPLACVQLLEALTGLGGCAREQVLVDFLDSDGRGESEHARLASMWIDQLQSIGLLWRTGDGAVRGVDGLTELFPNPLGLGTPMKVAAEAISVDVLRRMLRAIGVEKPPTKRVDLLAAVIAGYTDADRIRALVATAPESISAELHELANPTNPTVGQFLYDADAGGNGEYDDDRYDTDDPYGSDGSVSDATFFIDPARYARRREAIDWARAQGLAVSAGWGFDWALPAEVTLALRTTSYRAPFDPSPPVVQSRLVEAAVLDSHAAAAVSEFAGTVLAVLDRVSLADLPALRSGGVGARELSKLAKAVGCTEFQLRLVLQLCRSAGLIDYTIAAWRVTEHAAAWRSERPSQQIAVLLQHWLDLAHLATETRDQDGKAMAALTAPSCEGCSSAKSSILQMAATLPPSAVPAVPDQLGRLALWNRPFSHVSSAESVVPFGAVLAEATALGIIADGGLTSLGRALVLHQHTVLIETLDSALPSSATTATFGADLTVLVVGAPSLELSRLLDSCADRESSGGAIVWRFSPASIRRALDQGTAADQLAGQLSDIASSALPQPLRYLINDVGRRHGNLVVSSAVCVIRSDDQALLAEAVADRSLRKIELRLVAPTVAVAMVPDTQVLAALRARGYLPITDHAAPGMVEVPGQPNPVAASAFARAAASMNPRLWLIPPPWRNA